MPSATRVQPRVAGQAGGSDGADGPARCGDTVLVLAAGAVAAVYLVGAAWCLRRDTARV